MPASRWGDIVFAGDAGRSTLSRAVQRGRLRRIVPGIYTGTILEPLDRVVRRNWWQILAHEFPGAIIGDRSARTGSPGPDGHLTIIHPRRRPLVLPGLTILPRRGPASQQGDTALPDGVWMSSTARGLLDNAAGHGQRYMTAEELEHWVSDVLETHGEHRLNQVRDEVRDLALALGRQGAFRRLNLLFAAALATAPSEGIVTPALRARSTGQSYDRRRVELFAAFVRELGDLAPEPLPALPPDEPRRALLPFYEAYFSNYIEGTEFSPDEAASIIFEHQIPAARPEDAHDILGTYRIVADDTEMSRVAGGPDELVELLQARHAVVMAGRPGGMLGSFKLLPNRAGSTTFVDPELVEGTLRAGFDAAASLSDPFARAAYTMFLVAEVHPFADGNGRLARIMMNSELVHGGEIRIVIPTVFRLNYLSALKGATHNAAFQALVSVLRFAQRYTARVDFTSRPAAERDLARTNALRDPNEADAYGVRLPFRSLGCGAGGPVTVAEAWLESPRVLGVRFADGRNGLFAVRRLPFAGGSAASGIEIRYEGDMVVLHSPTGDWEVLADELRLLAERGRLDDPLRTLERLAAQ